MKTITLQEFIECYRPGCNNCTPYPDNSLKETLGNIIWDKRDYDRIASNIHSKTIWTITNELKDTVMVYTVSPGIIQNMAEWLTGYIVTEVPYHTNDISNLEIKIEI